MNLYICWETDQKGNPTGNERRIKASSIAYTEGVEQNHRGRVVYCKDGKQWYCSLPMKGEINE